MIDFSQNGESKILLELADKIGITEKTFVELGAGDGFHLSNTRLLKDLGWTGIMIDADNRGNAQVVKEFITLENINSLIKSHSVLSIDLDGNDYWILKKILQRFSPSIICFEVNSQLPLDECLVMPYNEKHFWNGTNTFGMSYQAGFKLCTRFGYMVYDVVNSTNIIAVKKEFNVTPKEYTYTKTWSHPDEPNAIWETI